ncbi:MAG: hypothetical protein JJW00_05760 [Sulfurimonas sp.]|nr:hypothetical protein [Sulfurimonas sp.]
MKITIDEYSKRFKMSKEMINSKIKSKKLHYVVENFISYIVVADSIDTQEPKTEVIVKKVLTIKPKTTVATVISLYQRENQQLKEKIAQLEQKVDKLVDDKEEMLLAEIDKIEKLYTNKDKQLKNILELVNIKMAEQLPTETIHEVASEVASLEKNSLSLELVELKEHLRTLNLKSYQRKIIKRRFIVAYDNDERILEKDGRLYLDLSKYDYSDLLAR